MFCYLLFLYKGFRKLNKTHNLRRFQITSCNSTVARCFVKMFDILASHPLHCMINVFYVSFVPLCASNKMTLMSVLFSRAKSLRKICNFVVSLTPPCCELMHVLGSSTTLSWTKYWSALWVFSKPFCLWCYQVNQYVIFTEGNFHKIFVLCTKEFLLMQFLYCDTCTTPSVFY